MKTLILAEKPSLAKEIAFSITSDFKKNSLGFWENENVIVANLVGHVLEAELPKDKWNLNNIPLKLKNLNYIPVSDKKKLVKDLVTTINRKDIEEYCSAGDADQEGSLLIHEIMLYAGAYKLDRKLSRMWILAMDKKSINKAYKERFSLQKDKPFINAGLARSYADMVVGLNLTQLFTLKFAPYKTVYSIGRVQTPTLKLIRMREEQIENFKPESFSTIKGTFEKDLIADLHVEDENGKYTSRIYGEKINRQLQMLDDKLFKVSDVKREEKNVKPDYLPNLNDVLKNIAKIYKYKAKSITSDIQELYEKKLVSYPRSEVRFLPSSMEKDIEGILNSFDTSKLEIKFDVNNKRIFNDEKIEAHYAIIPLKDISGEGLTQSQQNIYNYIRDKFLMAFMPDYKYLSTIISLNNEAGSFFQAKGRIEQSKGFRAYDTVLNKKKDDVLLPDIVQDETLSLLSYDLLQ